MLRVPDDGGDRAVSDSVSGVRHPDRASGAVAEQGPVQQAIRGDGGASVRERIGAASGPEILSGGETVRAMDLRYLERWTAAWRKPALRQMGVDEIHLGKQQKFVTVVSNLGTGEPLWFGRERKRETLDQFFQYELSVGQRRRIEAACVDRWEPYRQSIEEWAPRCRIVYDKFHILQHANAAVDEVRRAEFFRQGVKKRGLITRKAVVAAEPMEEPGEPAPW